MSYHQYWKEENRKGGGHVPNPVSRPRWVRIHVSPRSPQISQGVSHKLQTLCQKSPTGCMSSATGPAAVPAGSAKEQPASPLPICLPGIPPAGWVRGSSSCVKWKRKTSVSGSHHLPGEAGLSLVLPEGVNNLEVKQLRSQTVAFLGLTFLTPILPSGFIACCLKMWWVHCQWLIAVLFSRQVLCTVSNPQVREAFASRQGAGTWSVFGARMWSHRSWLESGATAFHARYDWGQAITLFVTQCPHVKNADSGWTYMTGYGEGWMNWYLCVCDIESTHTSVW